MQPISRVRPNTVMMSFGQDTTMGLRPKIAVLIAECIVKWANIETMLGILLTLLMETDAKATLAMYAALENRAAQLRMLEAAAKSKLSQDHFDVYTVMFQQFVKPALRERDKLAHWCWGCSPEMPDALLLMEPDEKTMMHVEAIDPPAPAKFDRDKIFVLTKQDMERMDMRLLAVTNHVSFFMGSVWKRNTPKQRASILQKLSNEPEIQTALARLRASREKPQEVPPLSLPPEPGGAA